MKYNKPKYRGFEIPSLPEFRYTSLHRNVQECTTDSDGTVRGHSRIICGWRDMPTLLVLRDLIHIFGEDENHPDNPGKLAFLMKEVLKRYPGDEYWNMNRKVHKLVANEEEMIKFFQSYTGWDGTFPFKGYVNFTIKSQ